MLIGGKIDLSLPTLTLNDLWAKYDLISLIRSDGICISNNLYINPVCHIESYGWLTSKKTATVLCFWINPVDTHSVSRRSWCVAEQPLEKQSCSSGINLFSYTILVRRFKMSLSNNFPSAQSKLIGFLFWGKIGSFPGFGKVTLSAWFHALGKYCSLYAELNISSMCFNIAFGNS